MKIRTLKPVRTAQTYFTVWAQCQDQFGATVIRILGHVGGMTDFYQPGWTLDSPTQFETEVKARKAAKHPYVYSIHDGNYTGGIIGITETWTCTMTETVQIELDFHPEPVNTQTTSN